MNTRLKRTNDELKADRPTEEEIKFIDKMPIYIMLENIRSVHNVGSIFGYFWDNFGVILGSFWAGCSVFDVRMFDVMFELCSMFDVMFGPMIC